MRPRVREALERLSNNVDFQVYVAHLEELAAKATEQLISAPAEGIILSQGRTQMCHSIVKEIKDVKNKNPS